MNCKICGSSEFCTKDGITYCTECQSQIEETQTEETVEPIRSRDGGSSGTKKVTAEKRKDYSDWITAEYFNHVLYMQVSALINLGASQNLKKTVIHIWSKYLQKCEIAFRTDYQAGDGKPHLGPVPSKRDIKILYGDKTISRRKRRLSLTSIDSVTSAGDTSLGDISDTDYSSDGDSIISEGKREKKKYSCHARKLLRKSTLKPCNKSTYLKQVFNLSLQKTLGICYLGLLYTEDRLSLLDLIRFAYEEKIPYINIIDKVPASLKIQDTDTSTFLVYTVPDAYSLLKMARDIAKFLKLPEFKEPSVFLAVSCFVKELNLPDDIKPIVKILIEKYKEQLSQRHLDSKLENVPHDYQALAFIIIALKMLFVLDDKFEIEHSRVMNKLNTMNEGYKYFEWEEWKKQSVIKEFLFLCENPGYSAINGLDGLNADKIISKYPFTRLKLPGEVLQNYGDVPTVKNNIISILSNLVNIPSFTGSIPTSFPLRSAMNCFIAEWDTLPMFKETQDIDFTFLKKDFSSHSLSFNPLKFDKEDNELSYLLMTSLYLPETSVDIVRKYYHSVTYHQQIIRTTSNYWFFNPMNSGKKDLFSYWFEKLPNSFKWLINFISKYAYCNNITLYKEIAKIEKILVLQKTVLRPKVLSTLKNKINVDF